MSSSILEVYRDRPNDCTKCEDGTAKLRTNRRSNPYIECEDCGYSIEPVSKAGRWAACEQAIARWNKIMAKTREGKGWEMTGRKVRQNNTSEDLDQIPKHRDKLT